MQYITIKRFKRNAIGGYFNIPYGTHVDCVDGVLWYHGKPICVDRSYSSHEHFAINDDGHGKERGKLTHTIIKELGGTHRPGEPTPEWDAIWDDDVANKHRRPDQTTWLWDDSFFKAPISELEHIYGLIKASK